MTQSTQPETALSIGDLLQRLNHYPDTLRQVLGMITDSELQLLGVGTRREILGTSESMCGDCEKPATWERVTQFSGVHKFCSEHAKEQEDFGESNPSYFFWRTVGP